MDQTSRPQQLASPKPHRHYSALSTITKSLFITAAVVGIVGVSCYSGYPFGNTAVGDGVSDIQKEERLHAFEKFTPMELSAIAEVDIPGAVESMDLSASSKQTLLSDLTAGTPSSGPSEQPSALSGSAPHTPAIQPSYKATSALGGPLISPVHKDAARLAWITLWDTDAEDGDAVRIDSQGYSRTVVLAKHPVTFALPIPTNGVVRITGTRDGEGGGITVGVASGSSTAILPIMSVGQVLNLKVRVN